MFQLIINEENCGMTDIFYSNDHFFQNSVMKGTDIYFKPENDPREIVRGVGVYLLDQT